MVWRVFVLQTELRNISRTFQRISKSNQCCIKWGSINVIVESFQWYYLFADGGVTGKDSDAIWIQVPSLQLPVGTEQNYGKHIQATEVTPRFERISSRIQIFRVDGKHQCSVCLYNTTRHTLTYFEHCLSLSWNNFRVDVCVSCVIYVNAGFFSKQWLWKEIPTRCRGVSLCYQRFGVTCRLNLFLSKCKWQNIQNRSISALGISKSLLYLC
jgi:hypothetical protein